MRRVALAALALLLAVTAVPAGAHDPSSELEDVKSEIESLTAQINRSRAESRQVAERLDAADERLSEVQAELVAAQAKVDAVSELIAGQEARLGELTTQLDQITAELAATKQLLDETESDLQIQAVEMYMNASSSMGAMVLNFRSASDLQVGLAYAGDVVGESEDLLDTFDFLRAEEERQQALVEGRRSEVQETIAGLETERAELEAEASRVEALRLEAEQELEEVRSLLASLSTQIAQAEEHKEGLEEDAQRLERELARIQANSGEKPGVLAWPVNGWLSSPFGYRVHPILGTRRLHSGIDLAASSGSPISAAASGVVIIAAPYGGYGNAVVIDHGGGLATLYAHQSRIVVSKGQAVATGDLIGYVGCTGLCTGPHLHFETRESGVPVDPMKYLRG
jgi:murein DD-endopeptidase MepM/ murein hydrolase activator NlpD